MPPKLKAPPGPDGPEPSPDNPPAGAPPIPATGSVAPIIGATGFNYTERWGSQRGQHGNFTLGSRPPDGNDWNRMTQEERDAVGIPDEAHMQAAQDAWQVRNRAGGDLWEERRRAGEAIYGSGATDWEGARQALINAGFSEEQGQNMPLFKQLAMAFQGTADPTGRYHWDPSSGWIDVGTSDPNRRGVPGMSGYTGPHPSGMEAIYAALPGVTESQRFQQWVRNSAGKSESGIPMMEVDPATGYYTGTRGAPIQYDAYGYAIDTRTGQRVGHYLGGDLGANPGPGSPARVSGTGVANRTGAAAGTAPWTPRGGTQNTPSAVNTPAPSTAPTNIPPPIIPPTPQTGMSVGGGGSLTGGYSGAGIGGTMAGTSAPAPRTSASTSAYTGSSYTDPNRQASPRATKRPSSLYGIYG